MSQVASLVLGGGPLGRLQAIIGILNQIDSLRNAKNIPALANSALAILATLTALTPSMTDDEFVAKAQAIVGNPKVQALIAAAVDVWEEFKPGSAA